MLPNRIKITRACYSCDSSFLTMCPLYMRLLDFLKGISWSLVLLTLFFSFKCPWWISLSRNSYSHENSSESKYTHQCSRYTIRIVQLSQLPGEAGLDGPRARARLRCLRLRPQLGQSCLPLVILMSLEVECTLTIRSELRLCTSAILTGLRRISRSWHHCWWWRGSRAWLYRQSPR